MPNCKVERVRSSKGRKSWCFNVTDAEWKCFVNYAQNGAKIPTRRFIC